MTYIWNRVWEHRRFVWGILWCVVVVKQIAYRNESYKE